jgi:hypothetical protein
MTLEMSGHRKRAKNLLPRVAANDSTAGAAERGKLVLENTCFLNGDLSQNEIETAS